MIFSILKITNVNIVDFCDADWADNDDDMKSTINGRFYLRNNLISWHNKE